MTTLDEQYADLLNGDDDPAFARLIAQLDTLGEGSPTPQGDMVIRHALAVHARDLAETGRDRPRQGGVWQHLRVPFGWHLLQARFSVAAAVVAAVLLSVGTYVHVQGPTPVSAQTVLHRAAAASPGANMASHATYRVSSSDGSTGTADVWIGYDGSGAATQLALNLTMSQHGQPAPDLNATLVVGGTGLTQAYHPTQQLPPPPLTDTRGTPPAVGGASGPGAMMKGIVVGTLLARKLSKQPDAYILRQETLDGVPVYALQPTDAGAVTYYFNAQSYALHGADWVQDGSSWQARLVSSSTVPLSSAPAHTFGPGTGAGQSSGEQGVTRVVDPGTGSATQKP